MLFSPQLVVPVRRAAVAGGSWQTTWTSPTMNSDSGSFAGFSVRNVIPAADISLSGSLIRATFNGIAGAGNVVLDHVSIVEQSSGAAGAAAPTEFLTSSASGLTAASGTTVTTDSLVFTLDETKSYLVIVDCNGSTGNLRYASAGSGAYYRAADASYNVQSPAGYTLAPETYWVSKIEVFV